MANLLELQEMLRNIPMGAVKGAAGGQHPTVPQWMAMDEIKRRGENMKAEQAQKSEEGIQEPAMIEQYLAAAQQIEGGQPPMGQPPMGQPPMGQPPMGQPPQMGPPQQGPPGMGGAPPQMGRMAQLGQLSAMAQQAQQPPAPRRPMPRRPPMQGGQGIRQLAAGGGLIKGYGNGGGVSADEERAEKLRMAMESIRHLPPEERAAAEKAISLKFGLDVDTRSFRPEEPSRFDRPGGLYADVGDNRVSGVDSTEGVYENLNWQRGDTGKPFGALSGVAKQIASPFKDVIDPIVDFYTAKEDKGSVYHKRTPDSASSSASPSTDGVIKPTGQTPASPELTPSQVALADLQKKYDELLGAQSSDGDYPDLREIIMGNFRDQEEKAAKQKKFNAWMSVAKGGAAALASGDPYALGAIGKGAQEGLGSFSAAQNVDIAQRGKSLDRALYLANVNASASNAPMTFQEFLDKVWIQMVKDDPMLVLNMTHDQKMDLAFQTYSESYGRLPGQRRGVSRRAMNTGQLDATVERRNAAGSARAATGG